MTKLTWTEDSKRWLKEIYDYIAKDNEMAAERVVRNIRERVRGLIQLPKMGRVIDEDNPNIRLLLYKHYRIVYLLKPDQNIDILGVYHGSLNIEDHFDIDQF